MDDATQKLVDEARIEAYKRFDGDRVVSEVTGEEVPHDDWGYSELSRRVFVEGATWALEAAQRPPVSPEAREEIRAEVKRTLNVHRGVVGHHKLSEILTDAILARFSVPSQPVYDEDAIARWLYLHRVTDHAADTAPEIAALCDEAAAALVAALRGGELTREETNRG